ncbi:MAG: uL15 family ribosomal protein, partial [Clostridia bacterium]|nr:uL15 family ribosomal protein [Clostridia bacterium]
MSDTPHFTEDLRTIVTEVVTAMLPTIQQQLAQSNNNSRVAYIEAAPSSDSEQAAATVTEISSAKKQPVKAKRVKTDTAAVSDSDSAAADYSVPVTNVDNDNEEGEELSDDYVVDDEWDFDDEEWNVEDSSEVEGEGGKKRRASCNFRQRLKLSSDKNRIYYAAVKNVFCAQRNVAYRVCGRVEKIKYHNELIAVIGVAKRSLKLWLALDPAQFDEERYFHKDVSDKPRFANVPMYVRVGSQRALNRMNELLAVLFEKFGIEAKRRYEAKPLQELIFTLRGNKLLKDKQNKSLLCEIAHVHDADVISDEQAQTFVECKDIEPLEEELFANIKLDDIDAKFADGQKVTLDMLKKKGVVSQECNGYRVLAGSRITKPLIIYANDIAISAVKMIALTGGRIIK